MEVESVGKKGQVKGRRSKFTVPTSKNNEQKEVHVAAPLQHVSTCSCSTTACKYMYTYAMLQQRVCMTRYET